MRILGVGSDFAHHYESLRSKHQLDVIDAQALPARLNYDVAITANEFFTWNRSAVQQLKQQGIPVLYLIDGIFEWRNLWEFPTGHACQYTMRPVLSDKVACLGRSQKRILETWGNVGKCELLGVPRFDGYTKLTRRTRSASEPFRILVMTAKNPGFDEQQVETTKQSLCDLAGWFENQPCIDGIELEVAWRIAPQLQEQVGVCGAYHETTGLELCDQLQNVDAVITTSSTAMLEAMLLELPVALLDYHQCPPLVPAAWTINSQAHIEETIRCLIKPAASQLWFQRLTLSDQLEPVGRASERLDFLVTEMGRLAAECKANNKPVVLPQRILQNANRNSSVPCEELLPELFPDEQTFRQSEIAELQVELAHTITLLELKEEECQLQQHRADRFQKRYERRTLIGFLSKLASRLRKQIKSTTTGSLAQPLESRRLPGNLRVDSYQRDAAVEPDKLEATAHGLKSSPRREREGAVS